MCSSIATFRRYVASSWMCLWRGSGPDPGLSNTRAGVGAAKQWQHLNHKWGVGRGSTQGAFGGVSMSLIAATSKWPAIQRGAQMGREVLGRFLGSVAQARGSGRSSPQATRRRRVGWEGEECQGGLERRRRGLAGGRSRARNKGRRPSPCPARSETEAEGAGMAEMLSKAETLELRKRHIG